MTAKLATLVGENRRSRRKTVLKAATIEFEGGIGCIVRNMSDTGAGIDVANPSSLPIEFDLRIEGDNVRRYCAIVWRGQKRVGVVFV